MRYTVLILSVWFASLMPFYAFSSCHVTSHNEEDYDDLSDSNYIRHRTVRVCFGSKKDVKSILGETFESYTQEQLKQNLPFIIANNASYPVHLEVLEISTKDQLRCIYDIFESQMQNYPFLELEPFKYKSTNPSYNSGNLNVKIQGDKWFSWLIERQKEPKRIYYEQLESQLALESRANEIRRQNIEEFEESNGPNFGMATLGYFEGSL